jgi:hypothetical protein
MRCRGLVYAALSLLSCSMLAIMSGKYNHLYSLLTSKVEDKPEIFDFVGPRALSENSTYVKVKQKVRAVVLVQADAMGHLHKEYKELWLQYMNKEGRIKVFFVYGTSANFMHHQSSNDLIFPSIRDSYYYRLEEVLCAFNYVESNYEYDYIVRTNLNTFWIWPRLLSHLDTLPRRGVYEGHMPLPLDFPPYKRYYVSDSDTIISRGMIQLLLKDSSMLIYLVKLSKDRISPEATLGVYFHNLLKAPLQITTRECYVVQGKTEATESLLAAVLADMRPPSNSTRGPSHVLLNTPKAAKENVDVTLLKKLIESFY